MSRAGGTESDEIAVITVHGTNDGADSDAGDKWWQQGSPFTTALLSSLSARGEKVNLLTFHWSGANSDLARRKGAEALAEILRASRRGFTSTHVVAHSHGGNVANVAADLIGWGRARRRSSLSSLVTVGTPFLKRRVSALEYFSAFIFLIVALLGIPLWLATALNRFAETTARQHIEFWLILVVGGVAILMSIVLTLRTAVSGVRRVVQPNAHLRSRNAILAIRHPQDEAISFLQKVDTVRLEPIPKGALLRASGNIAVALSTPVVNLVAIGLLCAMAYFSIAGAADQGESLAALFVLASCGLFCLLYLLCRFFIGVLPEFLLRRRLNARIVNSLRGVALGSDGVQRLGNVSSVSHTLRTTEAPLDASVVERMKESAAAQAGRLIDKYRWPLFTAGADANRSLAQIAEDALTWNSLIHTIYFDQPEIVDIIAGHISNEAASARTRRHSRSRRPRPA